MSVANPKESLKTSQSKKLDFPFIPMPRDLVQSGDVFFKATAFRVLSAFQSNILQYCTIYNIMKHTGLCRTTIERAVIHLTKMGFLSIASPACPARGISALYSVTIIPDSISCILSHDEIVRTNKIIDNKIINKEIKPPNLLSKRGKIPDIINYKDTGQESEKLSDFDQINNVLIRNKIAIDDFRPWLFLKFIEENPRMVPVSGPIRNIGAVMQKDLKHGKRVLFTRYANWKHEYEKKERSVKEPEKRVVTKGYLFQT